MSGFGLCEVALDRAEGEQAAGGAGVLGAGVTQGVGGVRRDLAVPEARGGVGGEAPQGFLEVVTRRFGRRGEGGAGVLGPILG